MKRSLTAADMPCSSSPVAALLFILLSATELQQAATAGIPVSPSMSGPEELMTQMEVFFKQHKYPDNKCFIL
jgi:hypothetical protein